MLARFALERISPEQLVSLGMKCAKRTCVKYVHERLSNQKNELDRKRARAYRDPARQEKETRPELAADGSFFGGGNPFFGLSAHSCD